MPSLDRSARALAALAALLVALSLPACGDDEEPATETAPAATDSGAEQGTTGAEQGATTSGGETGTEPEAEEGPPAEDDAEPQQCVYTAPPGRLAEDVIVIELSGVDCHQGQRLAKSAVGQPAGANLTLSRDGFECRPSTSAKGVNVTYTCTSGASEVRFDITWSAAGG